MAASRGQGPLQEAELAEIAARAAGLNARLDAARPEIAAPGPESASRGSETWRRVVGRGDDALFTRRLALDGLSLAQVGDLGHDEVPTRLPTWTRVIRDASEAAIVGATGDRVVRPDEPRAFEDILVPLVVTARHRVHGLAGDLHPLTVSAEVTLERWLLAGIGYVLHGILWARFEAHRAAGGGYADFAESIRGDGYAALFGSHPVAARLVGTMIEQWVDVVDELATRLNDDGSLLATGFGSGRRLGDVVEVGAGLAEPHAHGRAPFVLTYASGAKIVYKPRSVGLEAALNDLLEMMNGSGADPAFRTISVIDRTTHGYVEFVEHEPCGDRDAVSRFYQRAGMLTAIAYALGTVDIHAQNLIAAGEHPVVIDAEMLLLADATFTAPPVPGYRAMRAAGERLARSVLTLGILPIAVGRAGQPDGSALGGVTAMPTNEVTFTDPNTDDMQRAAVPMSGSTPTNSVVLDGQLQSPFDHRRDIEDGFERGYQALLDVRSELSQWLDSISAVPVRFLFRPSRVYGRVLEDSMRPDNLTHGLEFGVRLDQLSRFFVSEDHQERWWPLCRCEQASLERLDVPLFSVPAGGTTVGWEGTQTGVSIDRTPVDVARARLEGLGEDDLALQRSFVSAALAPRIPLLSDPAAGSANEDLDEAAALKAASEIAGMLLATAIRRDGEVTWINYAITDTSGAGRLTPTGDDMYSGATGIALFLAMHALVGGDEDSRATALEIVSGLATRLESAPERVAAAGLGGTSGLGSIVYATTALAELLDDGTLLEVAARAAALITGERIGADQSFDATAGAAGAILGLLHLHTARPDERVLGAARDAGEHLLATVEHTPAGHVFWRTYEGRGLTGMSHGASGIALALKRLADATSDRRYSDAATAAIAFEDSLFDAEHRNWPDLRGGTEQWVARWCHGATGIGLARVELDPDGDRITAAIETTLAAGRASVDSLCCGTAGRIDSLLRSGTALDRPELVTAGRALAQRMLDGSDGIGFALQGPGPAHGFTPGLFLGLAGVGYSLIRSVRPGTTPGVSTWSH